MQMLGMKMTIIDQQGVFIYSSLHRRIKYKQIVLAGKSYQKF